jgi:DNA-binding NarL/FixJ family response regulator
MKHIRVLLADDHLLVAESVRHFLQTNFEVIGIAHDGKTMLDLAREYKPDVVVADISMPLLDGIEAARIIRKELRFTKILFLTMHAETPILENAFRAGASGFVTKTGNCDELMRAIYTVARGETYIAPMLAGDLISVLALSNPENHSETAVTTKQRQIIQLIAEGKTMKEAADTMNISTRTAETHKYEVMRRLRVRTTAELIRYALRSNLA